jgi:TonB family protein
MFLSMGIVGVGVFAGWCFLDSGPGSQAERYQHAVDLYSAPAAARIHKNWDAPAKLHASTVVVFMVEKDGEVSSAQILKTSKYADIDQRAVDAVRKSSPLQPLPDSIREALFAPNPAARKRFKAIFDSTHDGDRVVVDIVVPAELSEQQGATDKKKSVP